MSSLIEIIFSYFYYFLPSLLLCVLVIFIGLFIYFIGKKRNIDLMDSTFNKFNEANEEKITNLKLMEANTTGRTYLGEVEENFPLNNFRLHFTLVPRHLIISKLASLVRKKLDYVVLEADPIDKVVNRYQIEILNKQEKKTIKSLSDMLYKLDHLSIGNVKFDETFIIGVNDLEFFQAVYQKAPQVVKNLYSIRNNLIRLSFYPLVHPSLRLVSILDDKFNPKISLDILNELTSTIASLAQKGYFAKTRSINLRVAKDLTLEKNKPKFK